MSFTRTKSGLSNLALFLGVDLIVFTEGGRESFSCEEAIDGNFNDQSEDIKFWSSVLLKHNFNKTIEYRSLGSKTSLKKICKLLVSGEIQNVVVTLDSDLDRFLGGKFNSPYILYTRGYSWENDVYHSDLVKEQLNSLIFTAELPQGYNDIVDESYCFFDKHMLRLLKLELVFRQNNLKLITDCHGERFINSTSAPRLQMDQVKRLIEQRKSSLARPVTIPTIDGDVCPIRYCYGKLRESLAMAIISYVARTLNGITALPKKMLVAAMIERYRNRTGHQEDEYYERIVHNLMAA